MEATVDIVTAPVPEMPIQLGRHAIAPFGLLVEASSPGADVRSIPIATLRQWVLADSVVVLRGFSPLSNDEMIAYAQAWGEILTWDFGAVLDLRVHETPQNYLFTHGNVPFHWDGAFARAVPSFQLFQCRKAPPAGAGGETLFMHTTRVWQRATPEQRSAWGEVEITYSTQKVAHYGGKVTARLLARHPHTSATTLRFAEELNDESVKLNPLFLDIRGVPEDERERFLADLRRALYDPHVCYAHAWRDGDLLLADNHALLHGRNPFRVDAPRHLQRIHII